MRAVLLIWAWTTRTSPREALDGFFRRRGEAGKFYCAACLIEQLRQRGSQAFSLASGPCGGGGCLRAGTLRIKPDHATPVNCPGRVSARDRKTRQRRPD